MGMNEEEGFQRLWPIYDEAKRSNSFIYDKSKKMWYTPEHFKEKYGNIKATESYITGFLEDLVVRDPVVGLHSGQKQLVEKIDNLRAEIAEELRKLSELNKRDFKSDQDKQKE